MSNILALKPLGLLKMSRFILFGWAKVQASSTWLSMTDCMCRKEIILSIPLGLSKMSNFLALQPLGLSKMSKMSKFRFFGWAKLQASSTWVSGTIKNFPLIQI